MADRVYTEPTLPEVAVSGRRNSQRHFALTVLYHPGFERIGDVALLAGLHSDGTELLSRLAPAFAPPAEPAVGYGLADPYLSRAPIELLATGEGIAIQPPGAGPTLKIDGQRAIGRRLLSWAELEQGVVLSLSHRVVLLLHPVTLERDDAPDASLVGESDAMRRVRRLIRRVATTDNPVLLLGETGTGKELVAGALHRFSQRADQPLLSLNMGALPAELAAAELFGVRRGAFTGAEHDRPGYFVQAHRGTLFLDEIGACAAAVQPQLLRALQFGEIQPVGSRPRRVDVRVIAATDADLSAKDSSFSSALRHRLAGFEIHLPPLRSRREDLGRLLRHFTPSRILSAVQDQPREVSRWVDLVEKLASYHWPGNVRELANYCRQLTIASDGLQGLVLPDNLLALLDGKSAVVSEPRPPAAAPTDLRVREAMLAARWEIARAARELQISRQALYRRIEAIPELRVAADIPMPEIESVYHECQGDLDAAALRLQVSRSALRRRWRALDLLPNTC